MPKKSLDRRALVKAAVMGGAGAAVAIEQLGGVPLFGTWVSKHILSPRINKLDAFDRIRDAMTGGPSALSVAQAMAMADGPAWIVVDIKVVNHVCTQLVFNLGTGPKGSANVVKATALTADIDAVSDNARFAALKFNKWFTNMLVNGTADGAAPAGPNLLGLDQTDLAKLGDASGDGGKVAFQAYLGLAQVDGAHNHSLQNLKLRQNLPDLGLFIDQKKVIYSPLGITCFMMGDNYDKAEGTLSINSVLDAGNAADVPVVGSRNVTAYVDQIKQYVGQSYADRASIEQNVVYRMDKLVDKDPLLRRELINSIQAFNSQLGALRNAANLETTFQTLDATKGNIQAVSDKNPGVGASSEFLAQCKYTAQACDLPGTPLRNFSLFLNMVDLDAKPCDIDINTSEGFGIKGQIRALAYTEGMRQLAMGLNVLAKKIAEGKKMIVYVHSEGGRDLKNGDNKIGFALVMGPKGADGLDDALATAQALVNGQVEDPGKPVGTSNNDSMPWDGTDILGKDGSKVAGALPATGDVGMGVVQFLEDKLQKTARADLNDADGRYVKLKRGA